TAVQALAVQTHLEVTAEPLAMDHHMGSGLSSHEPYLPNFASHAQTMGRRVIHSSADGGWGNQFFDLSPEDVVVIQHDVTFNSIANLHSVVVVEGGRLRFDPNGSQSLSIINLQVLPGGRLEIGTP